jgi:hypothetical protein
VYKRLDFPSPTRQALDYLSPDILASHSFLQVDFFQDTAFLPHCRCIAIPHLGGSIAKLLSTAHILQEEREWESDYLLNLAYMQSAMVVPM